MRKKILAFLGCFALSAVLMAQDKIVNDKNAQVRQVKDFHAIRVANGIRLYLNQSNEEAVAVSADEEKYIDHIKTEVKDGVLNIYYDHDPGDWKFWRDWSNKRLRAYVACKTLDALKASSGAQVEVDGILKSGNLFFRFSSGANFTGKVETSELKIDQNSGAEASISGTASNLKVEASSGSTLKGYELETEQCDASTSSGASIRLTVNKELVASASSGGQIYYKGTGVIKDISTSSGGAVSKR